MTDPRGGGLLRQRLAGLVLLSVIVGLAGSSVALYAKTFTPVVTVFVEVDRIGNQLSKGPRQSPPTGPARGRPA